MNDLPKRETLQQQQCLQQNMQEANQNLYSEMHSGPNIADKSLQYKQLNTISETERNYFQIYPHVLKCRL